MNCPNCGTAVRAGAQYCMRCGTTLADPATVTTQPATTVPASPFPPPPVVRTRPTSRLRSDRGLILLAIGILIAACLAFACTLSVCVLWSAGPQLIAWASTTITPHTPPSQTVPAPTVTPETPGTVEPPTPTRKPGTSTPPIPQPPEGQTVGYTAPDFTLSGLDSQSITLTSLRGTHVVLIDFWATWCGPCKEELPHIQDMYNRYKDRGFTALVINVRESDALAGGFIADKRYTFPVLLDRNGEVLQRYGVRGIPTAFILDTQGVIQKVQVGYRAGVETELAHVIESLLP